MARGGGVVAGSKHSVENEKHHSSGGGGGDADPKTMGIVFFICAFIMLILVIVIPIVLVADPPGDKCSPAGSVNRREQAVCVPDDFDRKWMIDTDSTGNKYGKFYKADNSTTKIITTKFTWWNYYAKLKGTWDMFAFSVPISGWGTFTVYCDGKKCEKLKMYLLNHVQYSKAVDSDNEFHDDAYKPSFKDFPDEGFVSFNYTVGGPEYWYLIFSNKKSKKVEIMYDITMYNYAYDTSNLTAAKPDGTRYAFENMKKGEFLIAEFPYDRNTSIAGTGVESFDIKMHNDRISWGGVIAVVIICGLLFIGCCILGLYYLILKH